MNSKLLKDFALKVAVAVAAGFAADAIRKRYFKPKPYSQF